jgi:predicted HTH transcriptional regulator
MSVRTRSSSRASVAAVLADLDLAQVEAYQRAIGASTPEGMLRARGLQMRDGRLTVAAYLLFAENPQDLYPNAHVRVLRYHDIERGAGAGLTLDAAGDVRFEATPVIPRDAWLEGLVNAVLHPSYSMAADHVRVEIFPNRIEIASPRRFPGLADPTRPLDISRYARNPRLARVCSDLGIAQISARITVKFSRHTHAVPSGSRANSYVMSSNVSRGSVAAAEHDQARQAAVSLERRRLSSSVCSPAATRIAS